jgi:hypothetical protein
MKAHPVHVSITNQFICNSDFQFKLYYDKNFVYTTSRNSLVEKGSWKNSGRLGYWGNWQMWGRWLEAVLVSDVGDGVGLAIITDEAERSLDGD